METNDRRKTFNTPLEWMRWALEYPLQRVAITRTGHTCRIEIRGREQLVTYVLSPINDTGVIGLSDCPLTAVEDEHGAIEEEKPKETPLGNLAHMLGEAIRNSNLDITHYALGVFEQRITKLIDERIAAATVAQDNVHGFPERVKNYYLLPKGDK